MSAKPKIQVLAVCPPGLAAVGMLDGIRRWADLTIGCDRETIARGAPTAEVILYSALAGGTPPFRQVWPQTGAALRWVHSFEAGVDRLLFPELVASPVPVTNARGVYIQPLAEFAVFGLLYFYKQGRRLIENQRARRWEQYEVESLAGKSLAVIGYGAVGQACARAARKLGMRILPVRRRDATSRAELQTLLGSVDAVLAAAPLTPETRHLLGAAEFAAMQPSAVVLNLGRGPVLDEAALVAALRDGCIAGAALDVFEREPLAADSPLWEMDNVLISPHCTDRTRDPNWTSLGMRCFLDNFRRYRAGKPLLTLVDKTAGY